MHHCKICLENKQPVSPLDLTNRLYSVAEYEWMLIKMILYISIKLA